ncbi:hypothetical protein P7F88_09940 [Vibrio hannami]|nr:hypothetical protein [Vibrio hannami]MDG3086413.1 hypothetical protein [Vibrio hannami]
MEVNIEQLTAFIAVYDTGSFALAAHKEKSTLLPLAEELAT